MLRARIEPVRHVQRARRFFGEHHQPAHARVRRRSRIPVRLLVADRREQAPVDADLGRRLAKPVPVLRQPRLDVLDEDARLDVVEAVRVAVVRVENRCEAPLGLERRIERGDALQQARVARIDRPRERLAPRTGRRRCESRDERRARSRTRSNRRRCSRTRAATADTAALRSPPPGFSTQDRFGCRARAIAPASRRARCRATTSMWPCVGLLDVARPRFVAGGRSGARAPAGTADRSSCLRRQADAAGQSRRGDVRAPRFELAHCVGDVRHGIDEQPHAQLGGEAAGQIEFRALRTRRRPGSRRSAGCA